VKCCGPTQAHEPRLTALLHREFPGLVTEVLALHPTRPWMLAAEGGKKIRDAYAGHEFLRAWREVLPRYAEMQRAATRHVREILGFGTPDHRATALAAGFADAVANEPALSADREDRITEDERRALVGLRPKLNDALGALAAIGIDDTLQHDDLHHGNVLIRDGRAVVFDWGDACVSHPFLTLAVTLRFVASATKHALDDAEIVALRDAYLEPWSDRASTRECDGPPSSGAASARSRERSPSMRSPELIRARSTAIQAVSPDRCGGYSASSARRAPPDARARSPS
jgi:hypothetical protein